MTQRLNKKFINAGNDEYGEGWGGGHYRASHTSHHLKIL